MPGFILHLNAQVKCGHGGVSTPTAPVPRVLLSGNAVVTTNSPHMIAGCPFTSAPGPCASGMWVMGSMRVFSMGMPVAIVGGVAMCVPNGAPMVAAGFQTRVTAM